MSDLFARVRPLVGNILETRVVVVIGSPAAAVLVEYLIACGVRHWLVMRDNAWMAGVVAQESARYGEEIDINIDVVRAMEEAGAADLALVVDDVAMAHRLPLTLPRLLVLTPTTVQPTRALLAMVGERMAEVAVTGAALDGGWDWLTAAPLMALAARALLLRASAYRMATWEAAWAVGARVYTVGMGQEPTRALWQIDVGVSKGEQPIYRTPWRRQGTLLVVGLGSLGSTAAQQLAPWVEKIILVDPDRVELVNLVRQTYRHSQIGAVKATVLAETLGAKQPGLLCEAVVAALTDEAQVTALVARFGVTAALVTTGTQADFAIARGLRALAIPHVVGRCYARARFWEGIVVDGLAGPSYEEVRRGVSAGPTPMPTPEEVAAYGAVGELSGEPATAMETGWAAIWLARLTCQMMQAASLREGWLLARLAAGASCLIGGAVIEEAAEEYGQTCGEANRVEKAYGIRVPGEVQAWSLAEIA